MSSLTPISGIIVRCDPTTKLYLEKKDSENIGSQRFIKCSLGDDCIFIEESKEYYVRSLINEWIDATSTPKKDDDKKI